MEPIVEAVKFAFQEAIRFCNLPIGDYTKLSLEDALSSLPSPKGRGAIIYGAEAERRLLNAVAAAIAKDPFAGRLDQQIALRKFKEEMVRKFVVENGEIELPSVQAALDEALKCAASELGDFVLAIPCTLFGTDALQDIPLGPAVFSRRARRWPALAKAYADSFGSSEREMPRALERYYGAFEWIVEVTVDNCAPSIAARLGERIAWSAIDCLQLFLGTPYLEHMGVGGMAVPDEYRGHLLLRNGAVNTVSAGGAPREARMDDESVQVHFAEGKEMLAAMGLALFEAYDLPTAAPIAERFVDAVHWYGLATRDRSPASKLVKYVIAIERILLATPRKDELSALREYAVGLIADWSKENIPNLRRQINELYSLRSQIAHGQIALSDPSISVAVLPASQLARRILSQALYFYFDHGVLSRRDVNGEQLDRAYAGMAKAKRLHARAQARRRRELTS